MKTEDEPITDDEWLIRLVWKTRVRPDRTPIIGISSFQPRDDEQTGISFFRLACLASPLDALNVVKEDNRDGNTIVLISVALIQKLHCTLRPDRIPQVAGHVLMPEVNPVAYRAEKQRLETLFLQLALEASDHIVRHPQD